MMNIKIIKTEQEYKNALARIEKLMNIHSGDSREDELELLSLLVEKYEDECVDAGLPDPVEAIKFRMEQAGLKRKDLVSYIGSQSKVSEVLNRKRPLSLSMIRALNEGLGISAEVLLQKSESKLKECRYRLSDYPFAEMFKRGYFNSIYKKLNEAKQYAEECLEELFINSNKMKLKPCCRQSNPALGDINVLKAWQSQVLNMITNEKLQPYHSENLNESFIYRITRLSYFSEGIRFVKEALNKTGIHFVILQHLPKTYLDGACFFSLSGNPVIAMTLRHDRLDNFWFTLLHELGHISNGDITKNEKEIIMDDTSAKHESDEVEDKADKFAHESFISSNVWEEKKHLLSNKTEIITLANDLGISPAIIAGRIRWEESNYTKFTDLIGQGEVRKILLLEI